MDDSNYAKNRSKLDNIIQYLGLEVFVKQIKEKISHFRKHARANKKKDLRREGLAILGLTN